MQFQKTQKLNVSAERAWEIVAHQFADIGVWSSAVASSAPNPNVIALSGAPVGGRICATPGFGDLEETFTQYSETNRQFTFRVSGMPSFIKLAQSTVNVRELGPDQSEVSLNVQMETNAIGKLMGPMFSVKLKSTLNTFLIELTDYAENGKVSPKKEKQLIKVAA